MTAALLRSLILAWRARDSKFKPVYPPVSYTLISHCLQTFCAGPCPTHDLESKNTFFSITPLKHTHPKDARQQLRPQISRPLSGPRGAGNYAYRTLPAPALRPPTLRRMCHLRSAGLRPQGLLRLQFQDRLCARGRAMQQPMHAVACGARRGSRRWLSALGLRRAAAYHTGSQPAAPNQRPSATASSRPSAYPASTSER